MAIYHIDFKILKRSEGRSSCSEAAYQARCKITDQRTGKTYDYRYRTGLYAHFILAPQQTPAHLIENSSALWNEVERVERQSNGQTSRYFNVAIPVELVNEEKIKLVREYCQQNFVDKGMIADIAFHDLDGRNPHAHVMLTLKHITEQGFGKKNRDWNHQNLVNVWREAWSELANRYLADAGVDARIDHRSLKEQRNEAIILSETEAKKGNRAAACRYIAKAIELNRSPLTRISPHSWNSEKSQTLRQSEQAMAASTKQVADQFLNATLSSHDSRKQ